MQASAAVRFLLLLIPALSASGQIVEEAKLSNQSLLFCISSYREGFYQKSIDCLNEVFPNLKTGVDSLAAYEYLALGYGMLNRIDLSKLNFRLAFQKNPSMDIDTLEFPPNISLIFSQVKLELEKARSDSVAAAALAQPAKPHRSIVLPVVLLSTGTAAACAGGYFFYRSNRLYQDYSDHRTALVEGAVCSGIAAAAVPVSLYLLLRKTPVREKTALINDCGRLSLAWFF